MSHVNRFGVDVSSVRPGDIVRISTYGGEPTSHLFRIGRVILDSIRPRLDHWQDETWINPSQVVEICQAE